MTDTIRRENEWIQLVPKAELHRHLQGSIRTSTILDVANKYRIRLPTHNADELENFITHRHPAKNLIEFLKPWTIFSKIIMSSEVASRITYEAIEDAASDNIAYLEMRFAPYTMSNNMKLGPEELLDAVTAAVKEAQRDFGIVVRLVLGIARVDLPDYPRYNNGILNAALDHRDFVVGFDLTGDEANFPPSRYTDFFVLARDNCFGITIHAGEAAGYQSVEDAIELLGAHRIGHGVSALASPHVMDLLRGSPHQGNPIPIEICPTSAYLTGTLPKSKVISTITRFLDRGVHVTICADNPQVCNTTLSREYQWLLESGSISPKQIVGLLRDGIQYSFAPDHIKTELRRSLDISIKKVKHIYAFKT
jgi:adenosine deaminase